jgi:hypothetical protein
MFDVAAEQQADKEWRSLMAPKGSDLPWAKLNDKLVLQIRARHAWKKAEIDRLNREHSAEAMAREFRVHTGTIEKVLMRKTWGHV